LTSSSHEIPSQITVFYDGSCPLCSAEIEYYKKVDTNRALRLVDVSSDGFVEDTLLTRQSALSRFHVRTIDGQLLSGARGFIEVWRVLPGWSWLTKLTAIPGFLPILELLYRLFLQVRPFTIRLFLRWRNLHSQPNDLK